MAEPSKEPRPSALRRLLEQPGARRRLSRALASLLAAALASIAAMVALLVWHSVRRARIIREAAGPGRPVRWPADELRVTPDDTQEAES